MFSQSDIDAVLADAQQAVTELASATGAAPANAPQAAPAAAAAAPAPPPRPSGRAEPGRVLRLKVPLRVRLAQRRMSVHEIMQMTSGSILEFEKRVDAELELVAGSKCIGTGEAVKIGENFGLKVRFIGDVRARLAAG
ncbi:MAG: FliM/FliN family flagellar motor switch protein [Phycisphaerae bacterium]